jgi:perosamine synthetase
MKKPSRPAIPWARPEFWGREERYLVDALRSTWISGGPYVDRLEAGLAAFHGVDHCLTSSNGTAALHLAFLALGIGRGHEVLVPGFGFQAAANVALHLGARPVFADVDPGTWCVTAESIEARLTSRTRAIVPVHTYGNVCPMEDIVRLARRRRIPVVEDAAESFGSRRSGRRCGTFGDLGILSFQATKTISTGEGGAVLTSSRPLYERMWLFRNHGMKHRRYWHEVAGHNFRLTNLQAALGCAQFEKLNRIAAARRRMDLAYRRRFARISGIAPQHYPKPVDPVVWAVAVRLDPRVYPQGRDAVIRQMGKAGIETRPGFHAPGEMKHLYRPGRLPESDALARQVISLPSIPTLDDGEIDRICVALARLRR